MKYRHVTGKIVDALPHTEGIYKNSPSWKVYEETKVDSKLTKAQLVEVAKKQGLITKGKTKEELLKSINVEDTTKTQDFNDDIV
jgi:hypothetical protein